jgi:hypothetical protein
MFPLLTAEISRLFEADNSYSACDEADTGLLGLAGRLLDRWVPSWQHKNALESFGLKAKVCYFSMRSLFVIYFFLFLFNTVLIDA